MKKRGIKILDELKLKAFYATGYLFLGELYADKSQNDKALETLKKAKDMFQKMGMDYYLTRTQNVLAQL